MNECKLCEEMLHRLREQAYYGDPSYKPGEDSFDDESRVQATKDADVVIQKAIAAGVPYSTYCADEIARKYDND